MEFEDRSGNILNESMDDAQLCKSIERHRRKKSKKNSFENSFDSFSGDDVTPKLPENSPFVTSETSDGISSPLMKRLREFKNAKMNGGVSVDKSGSVTRRGVVNSSDVEFISPLRKQVITVRPSYTVSRVDPAESKLVKYLVIAGWIFCFILVVRLLFAANGTWDYYKMDRVLAGREAELADIKAKNGELVREMERIRKDGTYQRQLARNALGVIAVDEFLVLFAKEKPLPLFGDSPLF
jgi:cell division protein FtsB